MKRKYICICVLLLLLPLLFSGVTLSGVGSTELLFPEEVLLPAPTSEELPPVAPLQAQRSAVEAIIMSKQEGIERRFKYHHPDVSLNDILAQKQK